MQRRRAIIAILAILFIACWSHVYMISCTALTYLYWLNPYLQWANPLEEFNLNETNHFPVPPILHQTWKTKELPEKWRKAQQSCIDLHPDYEYKFWTDQDALELIKEDYAWFLPTYLSYPYNIQRVDAVRYFILHKFGGIYMDLDMGCKKRIDFIRQANFTAPLTYPVGLSNDVMASQPGDIFLDRAVKQLPRWNHWLFIKYIQVMFGTGPMFLTVQYALSPKTIKKDVAAIRRPDYGKYDFSGDPYFYHLHGSSWHADDAKFIFWLDKYRGLLVGLGVVAVVGLCAAWMWKVNSTRRMDRLPRDDFDIEKRF